MPRHRLPDFNGKKCLGKQRIGTIPLSGTLDSEIKSLSDHKGIYGHRGIPGDNFNKQQVYENIRESCRFLDWTSVKKWTLS